MGISNYNEREKHKILTKKLMKEYHKRVKVEWFLGNFDRLLIDNGVAHFNYNTNHRSLGPRHKYDQWSPNKCITQIRDFRLKNCTDVGILPRTYFFSSKMHNSQGYNNANCNDYFLIQELKDRIRELEDENRELRASSSLS